MLLTASAKNSGPETNVDTAGHPSCGDNDKPSSRRGTGMLINFFYTLRAAKLKVSVKEYLTLQIGRAHV